MVLVAAGGSTRGTLYPPDGGGTNRVSPPPPWNVTSAPCSPAIVNVLSTGLPCTTIGVVLVPTVTVTGAVPPVRSTVVWAAAGWMVRVPPVPAGVDVGVPPTTTCPKLVATFAVTGML